MEIKEQQRDNAQILELKGKLDGSSVDGFKSRLDTLIEEDQRYIILDLANLEFITSSGLRILLVTAKKLSSRQGKLLLCKPGETVQGIFDVTGFSLLFQIYPSQEEALNDLGEE